MTRIAPCARDVADAPIKTLLNANAPMLLNAMTAVRHPKVEGEDTFRQAEVAAPRRQEAAVIRRRAAAAASTSLGVRVLQQAEEWGYSCSADF